MQPRYLLDNAAAQAPARLQALADLYDAGTIAQFEHCGVAAGWRCLEIGGGGGSIARWLADRAGPAGRVVATDIDTRHLEALGHPAIEVRRHDATGPLPATEIFDLVHARLVLNALANRDVVLRRLVEALAPGGWLVIEEFDSESTPPDPANHSGETYLQTHRALARFMTADGFDRRYGRRLFAEFRECGLEDVSAEARMFMCDAASPGVELLRANFRQLRDPLIAGGYITATQFDRDLAAMNDPDFRMPSSLLWAARGRRPASSGC